MSETIPFSEVPEGSYFRIAPQPRRLFFRCAHNISQDVCLDEKLILFKADAPCVIVNPIEQRQRSENGPATLTDQEVDAFLEQHKDDPVDNAQLDRVRARFTEKLTDNARTTQSSEVARAAAEEIANYLLGTTALGGQRQPHPAWKIEKVAAIISKHLCSAVVEPVGDRCTCNHRCPSRYERETEEAECVHADWCALMVAPALIDEVQRRMDQVVEAAVEWHQAGREGGEWLDTADRLASAIDALLELRSTPATPPPTEDKVVLAKGKHHE